MRIAHSTIGKSNCRIPAATLEVQQPVQSLTATWRRLRITQASAWRGVAITAASPVQALHPEAYMHLILRTDQMAH